MSTAALHYNGPDCRPTGDGDVDGDVDEDGDVDADGDGADSDGRRCSPQDRAGPGRAGPETVRDLDQNRTAMHGPWGDRPAAPPQHTRLAGWVMSRPPDSSSAGRSQPTKAGAGWRHPQHIHRTENRSDQRENIQQRYIPGRADYRWIFGECVTARSLACDPPTPSVTFALRRHRLRRLRSADTVRDVCAPPVTVCDVCDPPVTVCDVCAPPVTVCAACPPPVTIATQPEITGIDTPRQISALIN